MFRFERGLRPRNRVPGEASEGAAEAPSDRTEQMGPYRRPAVTEGAGDEAGRRRDPSPRRDAAPPRHAPDDTARPRPGAGAIPPEAHHTDARHSRLGAPPARSRTSNPST